MYLSSFSHLLFFVFFFNDTATTEIYTLSLHDALPISEQQLFDLGVKASRAGWVQENFITDDTEQIAAEAGEAANTAATKYAKEAHRFDGLQLSPELARKRLLLELAAGFPASDDPKAQKELAQILASLDGEYGKGKWCPNGEKEKCLDVTAIEKLMAESRDPEVLKRAWTGWHAIGAPMRQRYVRMVELGNEGARQLAYADVGALWRSNYDMQIGRAQRLNSSHGYISY